MQVFTLVTYGGGDILRELFNGIAAIFSNDNYANLLSGVSFIAFIAVMSQGILKMDLVTPTKWFVGLFILFNLLFLPKATLSIEDRIYQTKVYSVDNVPLALALFSSFVTQVFDGVTQLTESVYSLPDDFRYTKTGMVLGSSLYEAASKFEITNPEFSKNLSEYFQQCVFYDLLLGKYTASELGGSDDLWAFVKNHASPARAFRYNQQIETCQAGAASLDKDWQAELNSAAKIYGARFFPNRANADALLLSYLPESANYLTGVSKMASQLMQQLMMKNAIALGLDKFVASTNNQGTLLGFAFGRAQQSKRSLFQLSGMQAAYWLPLMKLVFEAILFGAFVIVMPLLLFPGGWRVAKHYFFALVWVESWAPLYAIVNLVMTVAAGDMSHAHASSQNEYLLNLFTMDGVAQVNRDIVALAGYFSLSVPMIAYYLINQSAMGFMSMAQYLGGAVQSSSQHAISETNSGNLSYGNVSLDNQSLHNMNANHFDTNARFASGASTQQLAGGSSLTLTTDGTAVLNNQSGISSLGTQVNLSNSIRQSLQKGSESAWSASEADARGLTDSANAMLRGVHDLSGTLSRNETSGEGSAMNEQYATNQSVQATEQLVHRFANDNHVSDQVARRALAGAYANLSVNSDRSLVGKVFGAAFGGGVSAGVKMEGDVSRSHNNQALAQAAYQYAQDTHFVDSVNQAVSGVSDHSYRQAHDDNTRLSDGIASQWDKAQQYREDLNLQFQHLQSYKEADAFVTENALSIQANAAQEFFEYLQSSPLPGGANDAPMGSNAAAHLLAHNPQLSAEYANAWASVESQKLQEDFTQQAAHNSGESVAGAYSHNVNATDLNAQVTGRMTQNESTLSADPRAKTLGGTGFIDKGAKVKYEGLKGEALEKISTRHHDLSQAGGALKASVISKQSKLEVD